MPDQLLSEIILEHERELSDLEDQITKLQLQVEVLTEATDGVMSILGVLVDYVERQR